MSYSGLGTERQALARRHVVLACEILLAHKDQVHYTQGEQRWQGINSRLVAAHGHFPDYGDCSSTATWILWNALHYHMGRGDIVSGFGWNYGNTASMLQHGVTVLPADTKVGDIAFYRNHCAVGVGGGKVFSHGSEGGPYKLDLDYRSDLQSVKRYL